MYKEFNAQDCADNIKDKWTYRFTHGEHVFAVFYSPNKTYRENKDYVLAMETSPCVTPLEYLESLNDISKGITSLMKKCDDFIPIKKSTKKSRRKKAHESD